MDLHDASNGEKVKTRDINLCQASQSFMIYILAAGTVNQDWPLDHNFAVDPKPGTWHITFYLPVDAKNGSNGHKAIDVGGSIKGIKTDHIFTLNKR